MKPIHLLLRYVHTTFVNNTNDNNDNNISDEAKETSFLYQKILVLMQRFNSFLLDTAYQLQGAQTEKSAYLYVCLVICQFTRDHITSEAEAAQIT